MSDLVFYFQQPTHHFGKKKRCLVIIVGISGIICEYHHELIRDVQQKSAAWGLSTIISQFYINGILWITAEN